MKTAVHQYETCLGQKKIYFNTAVQQRAVHFALSSTCCGPLRLFAPPPCGLSSSCFLIFWASFLICLTVLSEMPNFSATVLGFTFLPRCSRTSIFVLRVKFERFWPPADFLEGAPALPDLALDVEPALDELRGVVCVRCAAPFPCLLVAVPQVGTSGHRYDDTRCCSPGLARRTCHERTCHTCGTYAVCSEVGLAFALAPCGVVLRHMA